MIAEKWQLSKVIIDTLGSHHEPAAAEEENRQLVAIVALANMYANIHAFGSAGDPFQYVENLAQVLELVGMTWIYIDFIQ
jgi:HD-like signal output (HDOD) protein